MNAWCSAFETQGWATMPERHEVWVKSKKGWESLPGQSFDAPETAAQVAKDLSALHTNLMYGVRTRRWQIEAGPNFKAGEPA